MPSNVDAFLIDLDRELRSPRFLLRVGEEVKRDLRANTPVVTGRLRDSTFVQQIGTNHVRVGWNTIYARQVERRRGRVAETAKNPDPAVSRAATLTAQEIINRLDRRYAGTVG